MSWQEDNRKQTDKQHVDEQKMSNLPQFKYIGSNEAEVDLYCIVNSLLNIHVK